MEIYNLIKQDHAEINDLFRQIHNTRNTKAVERQRLFDQLKLKLLVHSKAEEAVFYSLLANDNLSASVIPEAKQDHRQMEMLLDHLDVMDCTTPLWEQRLLELEEKVHTHVREEEGRMFDKAHRVIPSSDAAGLGWQMQMKEVEFTRIYINQS